MTPPIYALTVPFPPSVNAYYDNRVGTVARGPRAGKRYVGRKISDAGLIFRGEVFRRTRLGHQVPPRLTGVLALRAIAFPPALDRRRDLDNLGKALLDSLVSAGVLLDDVQFDEFSIYRGPTTQDKVGSLRLGIWRPDLDALFRLSGILGAQIARDLVEPIPESFLLPPDLVRP